MRQLTPLLSLTIGVQNKGLGSIPRFQRAAPISISLKTYSASWWSMSSQKLDTVPKLERAIRATWRSIIRSDVLNLYSSWLKRMAAVIKAEGGPTRF